jgi:hypothetical protein
VVAVQQVLRELVAEREVQELLDIMVVALMLLVAVEVLRDILEMVVLEVETQVAMELEAEAEARVMVMEVVESV